MNYSIYINQLAAVKNFPELDIIDIAIFDYIKGYHAKAEKLIDSYHIWFWISHKKLIADMPILRINSKAGVIRRVNKLIEYNILVRNEKSDRLGKSFYRTGDNWDKLINTDTPLSKSTPPYQNQHPLLSKSTPPYQNQHPPLSKSTPPLDENQDNYSTNDSNTELKKEKPEKIFSDEVLLIYSWCTIESPTGKRVFPERSVPKTDTQIEKWKDCIRLLIDTDKRDVKEVCKVIVTTRRDNFWSANFLSILKLRKKDPSGVMYYDVFLAKMESVQKVAEAKKVTQSEIVGQGRKQQKLDNGYDWSKGE